MQSLNLHDVEQAGAEKKSALTLIKELAAALDREKIRYCHWKSNEALDRSLRGDNDLDLLVDPHHRFQFCRTLVRLGFKQASKSEDSRYPGIFHFYGNDRDSKKIVHVHVHFRLIVGCDLIKNYELPFVIPYLESAHDGQGLKVPSAEFENLVFVIRMVLKRRWLAWMLGHPDPRILWQTFSPSGRPALAGSEAREWADFQARVNREDIPDLLAKHLSSVNIRLFEMCEESLQEHAGRWEWLTTGAALCAALKSYQRYSTPVAVALACYRRAESLVPVIKGRLPFQFRRPQGKRLVAGGRIFAFIGGDGAGKTTNLNALQEWLGPTFDIQRFHLGKPPFGALRILYLFISKAIRVLMGNPPEVEVKPLHAITHVLVARGRWKLAKAAALAAKRGAIVLCDRFPIKGLELSEGPEIPRMNSRSRVVAWLSDLAQSYYDEIYHLGLPHHTFVLRVDPQMAIERKHEESPDFIRPRLEEVWNVDWTKVENTQVIDASQALATVFAEVCDGVWNRLPGWLPHIEIAGPAGAGKTTLLEELLQRGACTSGNIYPRKHPVLLLKNAITLWWAFFPYPFDEWRWMISTQTQFDLRERRIESRSAQFPTIYDQGPLFQSACALWMRKGRPRSRRYQSWHQHQIDRSRDILDLIIWLNADEQILRTRINVRSKVHPIKGKPDNVQSQFLAEHRDYFEYVVSDGAGNPMFSSVHFQTHDVLPSELADKVFDIIFSRR